MAHAEIDKDFLVAVYGDEDEVKEAIPTIREAGVNIYEVFTPYPVHGLEKVLGYPHSWTSKAAFMFGATGTCLAILLETWTMGFDWPMIIGGKAPIAIADFVPVIFELTVLLAAYGMSFSFFASEGLKPHKVPRIFDRRSTDDKMVMAIDLAKNKMNEAQIREILGKTAVEEVYNKEFTDEDNKPSFFKYVSKLFANGVSKDDSSLLMKQNKGV